MKPLQDITVIELGSVVLAPYACQILAELGARVIKVEPPEGDPTRSLGHAEHAGMAALFLNCNRGKQSVVIDLKRPEGHALLMQLVARADVLVHNMRFDSAERLGIGYERLRAVQPRLVYCATYGYGAAGRHAKRPAYDDIIQAGCGVAALKGAVDGVPAYAPTIIADKTTALFVAIGVMGALMERALTGAGRQLEVAMLETMTHFLSVEHLNGLTWEQPAGPAGYVRLLNPWRRPHRTQDGYLAVMPHGEKQWKRFLEITGRESLIDDPRFADPESRSRHVAALYEEISQILPTRRSAEWEELFTRHDIPYGRVNSLEDLVVDEHLSDVGFWKSAQHPTEGRLRVPSFPVRDGGPRGDASPAGPAPQLGQHSLEVIRQLGYDDAELDRLLQARVIAAWSAAHAGCEPNAPAAAAGSGGAQP